MNGVDFMYRWKPARLGEWNSFLLGSEVMFSNAAHPEAVEPADVARATENMKPGSGHSLGYTVYGQWQFNRRIYSGVRWDQTDSLFNPAMKRSGVTPYFSYYFSEFLRFRLNFEHRWSDFMTEKRRNSLYAEINWVFGAHPSEPFWVNK
jgi:hypothetical protein